MWPAPIVLVVLAVGMGLAVGRVAANGTRTKTRGLVSTASVTTTAAPRPVVYPRAVLASNVRDTQLREAAVSISPNAVVIELAPGVYANPRSGPLGRIDDYTFVFGRCPDINRYSQSHHVARACW
jgi:hypothetical protein